MEREYYLPDGDNERELWLTNFYTGVAALALITAWDISTGQLTSLENDKNAFRYSLVFLAAAVSFKTTSTASKDALNHGVSTSTPQAFPVFTPPAGAPTPVPPGIFDRINLFVGQLKKNNLYTEAIGIALGIVGAEIVVNFATLKPTLKLDTSGGWIYVHYVRDHAEGIFLYSKRGTETAFTLLAMVTKTSYVDARPNLVVGQAEERQYQAFYMVGDVAVGLISLVASITC